MSHNCPFWKAAQKLREIFAEGVKYKKRERRVRPASPGLAELPEYLTSYAFTPRAQPQDVGRRDVVRKVDVGRARLATLGRLPTRPPVGLADVPAKSDFAIEIICKII